MSTQLVFNNTNLKITTQNNQIYLTSKELSTALGYADDKSVAKIFSRNKDEFTSTMSTVVNLTTSANLKVSTRIFSLRGCHLIAMFSRTKIAKEFRRWVLDILDAETNVLLPNTITAEQQQLIKQAVNQRSYRTGEHRQAIYSKFYEYFKVPKYQDLPTSKFDEAIKWLGGVKIKSAQFTDDELCQLAWCYKAGETMRIQAELVTDALYQIRSDFAPTFKSFAIEYRSTLELARKIIERETIHIQQTQADTNWSRVLPSIRILIN